MTTTEQLKEVEEILLNQLKCFAHSGNFERGREACAALRSVREEKQAVESAEKESPLRSEGGLDHFLKINGFEPVMNKDGLLVGWRAKYTPPLDPGLTDGYQWFGWGREYPDDTVQYHPEHRSNDYGLVMTAAGPVTIEYGDWVTKDKDGNPLVPNRTPDPYFAAKPDPASRKTVLRKLCGDDPFKVVRVPGLWGTSKILHDLESERDTLKTENQRLRNRLEDQQRSLDYLGGQSNLCHEYCHEFDCARLADDVVAVVVADARALRAERDTLKANIATLNEEEQRLLGEIKTLEAENVGLKDSCAVYVENQRKLEGAMAEIVADNKRLKEIEAHILLQLPAVPKRRKDESDGELLGRAIQRLKNQRDAILQEARLWAGGAKTQRHVVNEVGSLLGGVADWGPIAKGVEAVMSELALARKVVETARAYKAVLTHPACSLRDYVGLVVAIDAYDFFIQKKVNKEANALIDKILCETTRVPCPKCQSLATSVLWLTGPGPEYLLVCNQCEHRQELHMDTPGECQRDLALALDALNAAKDAGATPSDGNPPPKRADAGSTPAPGTNLHDKEIEPMRDIEPIGEGAAKTAALPLYKCHKVVQAAKITAIEPKTIGVKDEAGAHSEPDGAILFLDCPASQRRMTQAFMDKHQPKVGGYLVIYEDGYHSFSPAGAFEKGYSLIGGPTAVAPPADSAPPTA